jgi:hypothetical protein
MILNVIDNILKAMKLLHNILDEGATLYKFYSFFMLLGLCNFNSKHRLRYLPIGILPLLSAQRYDKKSPA